MSLANVSNPHFKEELIKGLYSSNIVSFGQFKLKSGVISPYYLDLRQLFKYPAVLNGVADGMSCDRSLLDDENYLIGVPYGGIPLVTMISQHTNMPFLLIRKEPKTYGTKKIIEGLERGITKCILVEDVITSGKSIEEVIQKVKEEGVEVTHVLVCIDREEGGMKRLRDQGVSISALFTITELLQEWSKYKLIPQEQVDVVQQYLDALKNKID